MKMHFATYNKLDIKSCGLSERELPVGAGAAPLKVRLGAYSKWQFELLLSLNFK